MGQSISGRCLSSGATSVGAGGQGGQLLQNPSPVPPSLQGAWVCACDFTELGSPPPKGVVLGMLAHRKTAQFLQRRRYEGTKALVPGKRQDRVMRTVSAPLLLVSGGTCGRIACPDDMMHGRDISRCTVQVPNTAIVACSHPHRSACRMLIFLHGCCAVGD